jgi:sarcosine oxidase subunit alpha
VGKLDIEGKEIVPVLERLFSPGVAPEIGQVRRTVPRKTDGVLVAEGSCCRLRSDQALVMTSPGTMAAVEQMFKEYIGAANGCAHLTNLTSALAAVHLVGPCSHELLRKLTALDLSPLQFSNLTCVQGSLAKVPALIVRADVGNELAYEVYCGREYGEYLWDTLMDAGQEFGRVPFGLAAYGLLCAEG